MKLVIGGSSGFVGTEVVRQALSNPAITSIIGVSRRETPVPPGSTDASGKLKSVICEDFESYSASIKKDLEDADACIWYIYRAISVLVYFMCYLPAALTPEQDNRRDSHEVDVGTLGGGLKDISRLCHHSYPDSGRSSAQARHAAPLRLHGRAFGSTQET